LAEKLDHKIEIQRALATLGSIYLEQTLDLKETDRDGYNEAGRQAKSHLLKSIDAIPSKRDNCCTSREAADMKVAANTNLYMLEADVTLENGHSYYKEAERIGEEHDLHHSLFALYDFAMKLYLGKNDFVAAKAHIVSSLSSLKHLEGSHDFNILNTETTCYRAKIAIGLDDFSGAKKLLSKRKDKKDEFALACRLTKITKKINRNPDNQIIKCMLYDELGDIMMDEFDYKDNALRYYDKAFNACPVTDVRRKSRLLFSMGEIKRELKQWDEAVKYYTIDVQLCKEDNPGYAVHSAIWRAVCLAKLEQPKQSVLENFDIALKMSQRAKCRNQEKHVLDILLEYLKDYDNLKADEIEVKLQQYRDVKDVDSEPDDDVEKQRLLETLDDSTDSEEELTQFSSISKHCKYRIKVNSKGEKNNSFCVFLSTFFTTTYIFRGN
jgi:tetratricopeptide (TPR) repeat protein